MKFSDGTSSVTMDQISNLANAESITSASIKNGSPKNISPNNNSRIRRSSSGSGNSLRNLVVSPPTSSSLEVISNSALKSITNVLGEMSEKFTQLDERMESQLRLLLSLSNKIDRLESGIHLLSSKCFLFIITYN